MIEVTILGCASSLGVPVIGCKCSVCLSASSYNKRLRSSLIIKSKVSNVLIDCGFDIRTQLIRANIDKLDAVILTHDHADHISGLDDLRVFSAIHKHKPLPLYMSLESQEKIRRIYDYLFANDRLEENIVDFYSQWVIGDIKINFFKQDHIVMNSLGIKINNFVYSNDVAFFYEESEKYLENLDVFVVDCCEYLSTPFHAGLERVLEWHDKFKPKQTYLINLSHKIDYFEIQKHLPKNILPTYDGLKFLI